MVNNFISAACWRQQPGMWDAPHCTWSHITPPMVQPHGRLKKGVCAMTAPFPYVWCVCVCGPCVCIHFLLICCAPSMLPKILHPNHNYNVISRIRQCPCCCFTLSFYEYQMLSRWAQKAAQLALRQACGLFVFIGLGGVGGCLIALSSTFWQ